MRNVLTRLACVCTVTLLMNFGQSRAGVVVSNLSDTQNGAGTIYAPPRLRNMPRSLRQEARASSWRISSRPWALPRGVSLRLRSW